MLGGTVAVSLEERVPTDNFHRHLEAKLDLRFVHDWTRGHYAERGRPFTGPGVFFKRRLVMFFVGICSEGKRVAMPRLNLADCARHLNLQTRCTATGNLAWSLVDYRF